jgi:hypothetical protein
VLKAAIPKLKKQAWTEHLKARPEMARETLSVF